MAEKGWWRWLVCEGDEEVEDRGEGAALKGVRGLSPPRLCAEADVTANECEDNGVMFGLNSLRLLFERGSPHASSAPMLSLKYSVRFGEEDLRLLRAKSLRSCDAFFACDTTDIERRRDRSE